jgi:hypothetical protein
VGGHVQILKREKFMLGISFVCGAVVAPVAVRVAVWRLTHVLNMGVDEQRRLEVLVKNYYRREK